ncbi:MAG: radical SAM protein [Syntrophomonas sp.]|nr:radical SAM protein [Syntrophomonas sp.]
MIELFRSYSDKPYIYDGYTNYLYSVSEDIYQRLSTAGSGIERDLLLNSLGIRDTIAPIVPLAKVEEDMVKAEGPERVVLEMTEDCNLRCRYCPHTLADSLPSDRPHRRRHMTKEVIDLVFSEYFSAERDTVPHLFFYGGEPLLNYDMVEYAVNRARALSKSPMIFVVTNGLLLTEAMVEFFAANEVGLQISLDGPHQDEYRKTADGRGSLAPLMTNLKWIMDRFPEFYYRYVIFNATITQDADFDETVEFFDGNEMLRYNWQGYNWEIYGLNNGLREADPVSQRVRMCQTYVQDKGWEQGLNFPKLALTLPTLSLDKRLHGETEHAFTLWGCRIYKSVLFVGVDGQCSVCEKIQQRGILGRLGDDAGIRQGALDYYRRLYALAVPKCGQCWANKICQLCAACVGQGTLTEENFQTGCAEQMEAIRKSLVLYASLKESGFDYPKAIHFMKNNCEFCNRHYSHIYDEE